MSMCSGQQWPSGGLQWSPTVVTNSGHQQWSTVAKGPNPYSFTSNAYHDNLPYHVSFRHGKVRGGKCMRVCEGIYYCSSLSRLSV
jgi:hypothetical protein